MLRDGFGRTIDYLRVSITEHCNLRCLYCMPLAGVTFAPREDLLTAAEIETVCQVAVAAGFRKIRLTGGEPTLRHDVVDIVRRLAAIPGLDDLAMTTNGLRLPQLARPLKAAGLRRVNIHVDSLDPVRVAPLMRWSTAEGLWAGVEAAVAADLTPVKLNCVVARGYNEADVVDLARLSLTRDWHLRFIELMPLGTGTEAQFAVDHRMPSAAVAALIEEQLGLLTPVPSSDPADESVTFRLPGAAGTVGFIAPVSAPYCATCNRLRLTADGKFHLCLLHDDEIDVRAALRSGSGDLALVRDALERAVSAKPTGHSLDTGRFTRARRMHAIGG